MSSDATRGELGADDARGRTVAARFADMFGRAPDGVWSAPGRVNLIGEFTDVNEGFVLPTTLPMAAHIALSRRDDELLRIASVQEARPGDKDVTEAHLFELSPGAHAGFAGYVLGVAWALHQAGERIGGANILVDSDVPIGAGLSSSAALECATGLALRATFNLDISLERLAHAAQHAENDYVGVPCGIMDQMASLLCVPSQALLLDTRSLEHRQVPFALREAGLVLMVLDTRVRHALGDSAYAERRRSCEEAAEQLGVAALRDIEPDGLEAALARLGDSVLERRVRHVVTEGARVLEVVQLLESGRVADIGPVLAAGHASLRDDFEVSCPELDVAVETALGAGALGARMVGGGFGGSAIALAEKEVASRIEASVCDRFARSGFREPRVVVAVPSATTRASAPPVNSAIAERDC